MQRVLFHNDKPRKIKTKQVLEVKLFLLVMLLTFSVADFKVFPIEAEHTHRLDCQVPPCEQQHVTVRIHIEYYLTKLTERM